MLSALRLKPHGMMRTFLAASALLICSGPLAISQASTAAPTQVWPPVRPATSAPVPATSPSATASPTLPETQPSLDEDRDPIPSPDVTANAAAPATSATPATANVPPGTTPSAPTGPGEIQKKQNGVYTLRANVDEVLLNCAVIDDKGRPVLGLDRADFRVWEDGIPQTVNSVQHADLPVSMGILVDNSGSMRDKRATVNAAAMNLLRESNPQDEAFIVNFSDRPYLDQRFTTDRVALNRGITRYDSAGTTALYDAVAASADELAKHGKDRKQVLLIITDGADNASRIDLQQAIRRVQGLGGPVVYTIGLLFDTGSEEAQQARDALEELSQQTGGVAYFPNSLEDVNAIATEVANDIRQQYVVDYHSSKPFSLGGYRTVQVEASAPHDGRLYVRTKRGYYAQAQAKEPGQEAEQ